jgi:hypothetical protein
METAVIIQVLLVVALVAVVLYLFFTPSSASRRAWLRIAAVVFLVVFVIGFLFPGITADIANWVGVKSGTELLVYVMFVAWVVTSLVFYTMITDLRRRQATLVQELAQRTATNGPQQ